MFMISSRKFCAKFDNLFTWRIFWDVGVEPPHFIFKLVCEGVSFTDIFPTSFLRCYHIIHLGWTIYIRVWCGFICFHWRGAIFTRSVIPLSWVRWLRAYQSDWIYNRSWFLDPWPFLCLLIRWKPHLFTLLWHYFSFIFFLRSLWSEGVLIVHFYRLPGLWNILVWYLGL